MQFHKLGNGFSAPEDFFSTKRTISPLVSIFLSRTMESFKKHTGAVKILHSDRSKEQAVGAGADVGVLIPVIFRHWQYPILLCGT